MPEFPLEPIIVHPEGFHTEKTYYNAACTKLRMHSFSINGCYHGQYMEYYRDGSVCFDGFQIEGKWHGELTRHYKAHMIPPIQHSFLIKGKLVEIPFLPDKPKALPSDSGRNRYQTLEVE